MATVGNLFVNIRGRTNGLVRDLRKARKAVKRDFYRNEAMALQDVKSAIRRKLEASKLSPAIREKRAAELDLARRRLDITRRRPARLERRRELLARKAGAQTAMSAFMATPLGQVASVLGVIGISVAAFRSVVNFTISSARRGSQLTEAFKYAGPMGPALAKAEAFRIQQQLAFAKGPAVSAAKMRRTESELLREQASMSYSAAYDNVAAFFNDIGSRFLTGGFDPIGAQTFETRKMLIRAQMATGLTGQTP